MTALALKLTALRLPAWLREHWRAVAVLGTMAALWLVAGLSVAMQSFAPEPELPGGAVTVEQRLRAAAAATSATQLKAISANNALAINAAIPIANLANPAARPFSLAGASAADQLRSLDCLTAAIYYEAAREPLNGQRAVAQVVLNRVRHPAYPKTVCGVVFEGARRSTGCQFSFSCDGSLRRAPMADYWERARAGRRRRRSMAMSTRRSAGRPIITPIMWCLTGPRAWSSRPMSACTSSIAGAAAGAGRRRVRHPLCRGRAGDRLARRLRPAVCPPRLQTAARTLRDRLAAEAAAAAEAGGCVSVDSFQRAVLRRYEPFRRDTANAQIAERARADTTLTTSQRWALTGRATSGPPQRRSAATTRPEQPRELQGVRYRWDPGRPRLPPRPRRSPSGADQRRRRRSETATR